MLFNSTTSAVEYRVSLGGGCTQLLHSCLKSNAIYLHNRWMCIIINMHEYMNKIPLSAWKKNVY